MSRTSHPGLPRPTLDEPFEPRVRRLVSTQLGVGPEQLVANVSLRDDLAADSLDLAELALALDGTFTIVVPDRILANVRTYHDLVEATGRLVARRALAI